MHLCVVTPQPTPYRDPFWNTVAEQPGVELDVFYCYAKGDDRPWEIDWPFKFHAEVLPGRAWLGQHNGYWNPSILKKLRAKRYDAIILGGYNHFTMLAAAWYARKKRIPYLVMCESFHGLKRARYRKTLKTPLVQWVVGGAAGILPTGQLAREYLISYGGRADRCAFVPNSPDLDSLRREAAALYPNRPVIRQSMNLGNEPVILFVGRLINKKGVDILLEAFARVVQNVPSQLLIAGDGPERTKLEEQAARLRVNDRVHFVGFQQPKDLPRFYCAADLFVLPSRTEPWGVVVMEALASGLPVVVSNLVGCYPDVINDDQVGRVVAPEDPHSLAEAMRDYLLKRPDKNRVHQIWEPVYQRMRHPVVASNLVGLVRAILKEDGLNKQVIFPDLKN
ncbi:MAG: glycosyltransferase family 4 protein [Thermogutta sp.]|uniref:glycosyltransferase family 4 protein n=1 Tax=Thermogutta sp. TaxID=1962930 RepID=UPI0019949F18|nr:glycosyltransferase family 4 protein [Thermogutta sp.]MBC7351309.1 glycosyltransferase family 4 protein [Thermogutta sp.]